MDLRDVHEAIGGIGHWITRKAFYSGNHVAIIDGERRISYADFDRRTDKLASALRDRGVRQGDRVASLQYNGAPFLELLFATAKLGAIFVPINFRLAPPEITYLLADSGADIFVWSDSPSQLAGDALRGEGVRVRLGVTVGGIPSDGVAAYETLFDSGEPGASTCGWPAVMSQC